MLVCYILSSNKGIFVWPIWPEVLSQRPPYWPEMESRANMGPGMITRPIWKCPCIKLFITYFQHLEKRHPYWPETKSRPILAWAIWASIWKWSCSNPITGYFPGVWKYGQYFRSYWSYKNAFIWTKYVTTTLLLFIYCYKIYHESALKKQNHQPHVFIIFERWNIRGTISQKINHFLQIWETNLLKLYKNKRWKSR
jgi:hypothetical protein